METCSSLEDLKSTVDIRAIISAYENKVITTEEPFTRTRTKSVGDVLSPSVTVRENPIKTLNDIKKILENLDKRIHLYEIYNKEKHVKFQEELFNILSSIINIDNDDPEEAKRLISKTKNYVSFLNTKLPSNGTTKNNSFNFNGNKFEKPKEINEIDEIDNKSSVSVRELKERFQDPKEKSIKSKPKPVYRSFSVNYATNNKKILNTNVKEDVKKVFVPEKPVEPVDVIEDKYSVSVKQLKNMFESKSKEGSNGISVILKPEPKNITRLNYKQKLIEVGSNDLDHIQVSSYIQSVRDEPNALLEIIRKDREELNGGVIIENGEADLENNGDNDDDDYAESSSSSRSSSIKSGDSVKRAVLRVEMVNDMNEANDKD